MDTLIEMTVEEEKLLENAEYCMNGHILLVSSQLYAIISALNGAYKSINTILQRSNLVDYNTILERKTGLLTGQGITSLAKDLSRRGRRTSVGRRRKS